MSDKDTAAPNIKTKDTTIKIKTKKHPRHDYYHGNICRESTLALTNFLRQLSPEQYKQFEEGDLSWELDKASILAREMIIGDKIGMIFEYENGWVPTFVELTSIVIKHGGNYLFQGIDNHTKDEIEFDLREISLALAMGYCEILYRNNKPYGLPEEQELKIRIHYREEEEDKDKKEDNNTSV